jgi:hypothetical protein
MLRPLWQQSHWPPGKHCRVQKDITANIDSGGWCYIKVEYKLNLCRRRLRIPRSTSGKKPLNLRQQANIHNSLFYLARCRDKLIHTRFEPYETSLQGHPKSEDCIETYGRIDDLIFRVDLKCRAELVPLELLVELHKEQSYKSEPGVHTVQDSELKMEIEWGSWGSYPRNLT